MHCKLFSMGLAVGILTAFAVHADDAGSSASSAKFSIVMSAEQLREAVSETRVLDVRSEAAYNEGHVPNAVLVDLNEWRAFSASPGGMQDAEGWGRRLGALGIERTTPVVVYSDRITDAARVWWLLTYVGVPQAAVLDGGIQAWVDAGGALANSATSVNPASFEPKFQTKRFASHEDVLKTVGKDSLVRCLDTRSAGEFLGTAGPAARKGRVPGAVHFDWSNLVNADGRLKSTEQIRELLSAAGVGTDDEVIVHCQSGARSSVAALALESAGMTRIRNYYPGWSEWSKDDSLPVATGP